MKKRHPKQIKLHYWMRNSNEKYNLESYPEDETADIPHTVFKIVVHSEGDKQKMLNAFKYIHDSNIDTNLILINQLAHVCINPDIIKVEPIK